MKEYQRSFENIKKLQITSPVLHILMANNNFRLENNTSKTAAEGTIGSLPSRSVGSYWLTLKEITKGNTKLWHHRDRTDRFGLQHTWF